MPRSKSASSRQRLAVLGEHAPERDDVVARRRLVEGDAEHRVAPLGEAAQVHAGSDGAARQRRGRRAGVEGERVEGAVAAHGDAERGASPRRGSRCTQATRSAIRFRPAGPW